MNHAANKGFTLIELLLAMSFVSMLLLAIAMTVIQVGSTYNRGMLLKEVNQTSRAVTTSMLSSISAQGNIDLTKDYRKLNEAGVAVGGRLCLGAETFIWNYAEALQRDASGGGVTLGSIVRNGGTGASPVKFIRLPDPTKKYCALNALGNVSVAHIPAAEASSVEELIKGGDRDLNIYQFDISSNDASFDSTTGQRLYTITFTIGSGNIEALNASRTLCKGPGEPGSDLQYCAVEQFTITVRSGGKD